MFIKRLLFQALSNVNMIISQRSQWELSCMQGQNKGLSCSAFLSWLFCAQCMTTEIFLGPCKRFRRKSLKSLKTTCSLAWSVVRYLLKKSLCVILGYGMEVNKVRMFPLVLLHLFAQVSSKFLHTFSENKNQTYIRTNKQTKQRNKSNIPYRHIYCAISFLHFPSQYSPWLLGFKTRVSLFSHFWVLTLFSAPWGTGLLIYAACTVPVMRGCLVQGIPWDLLSFPSRSWQFNYSKRPWGEGRLLAILKPSGLGSFQPKLLLDFVDLAGLDSARTEKQLVVSCPIFCTLGQITLYCDEAQLHHVMLEPTMWLLTSAQINIGLGSVGQMLTPSVFSSHRHSRCSNLMRLTTS